MYSVTLVDGKYIVSHDNGYNFKALRYGKKWRDLTGDGLILALVHKIEELEDQIEKAKKSLMKYPITDSSDIFENTINILEEEE